MAAQDKLILGMASGYAAKDLRPFVQSLAMTGFQGRLVLFVYKTQHTAIRAMAKAHAPGLDLELATIDGIHRYAKFWRSCFKRLFAMLPAEASLALKRRLLRFQGMPHVTRYFHYANYLEKQKGFAQVLLSDVRDVIFQSNPFDHIEENLYLGMENSSLTIASEPFDREWILDAYGEAMLQRIGNCQISCSGVTLGDIASIRSYVSKIINESLCMPFTRIKTRIYDQAFHNKLLHCDELTAATLCQPLRSPIATVGCMQMADFVLSSTGELLNEDGKAAPIVHQYDRHPSLVEAFMARILN